MFSPVTVMVHGGGLFANTEVTGRTDSKNNPTIRTTIEVSFVLFIFHFPFPVSKKVTRDSLADMWAFRGPRDSALACKTSITLKKIDGIEMMTRFLQRS